jgi:hypothetical protein
MVKEVFEQLGHALIGFIPLLGWIREGNQLPCATNRLPVESINGHEYWPAERVEDMYRDFGGYAVGDFVRTLLLLFIILYGRTS